MRPVGPESRWIMMGAAALGMLVAAVALTPTAPPELDSTLRADYISLRMKDHGASAAEAAAVVTAASAVDADPEEIERMLEQATPTRAECQAFHAAHPELFGNRSFQQSEEMVRRILTYRFMREKLGLPDPLEELMTTMPGAKSNHDPRDEGARRADWTATQLDRMERLDPEGIRAEIGDYWRPTHRPIWRASNPRSG